MTDPRTAALTLACLAAAFAVKHYAADFVFQTNWMARGKEQRTGWVMPLLAHVSCHAVLALVIALAVAPRLWWLAAVDFAVHFGIDIGKARLSQWGRWSLDRPQFWWVLGFDQLLHQLTNVALASALVFL